MNKAILMITFGLLATGGFAQVKKSVSTTKPAIKTAVKPVSPFKNNIDSISYAVGLRIAQSLKAQGFDNINMTLFNKAMRDLKQNKPSLLSDIAVTDCISKFQQIVNAKKETAQQKENSVKSLAARQEGQAFLANNGKRAGVVTLPSGIQYEIIKAGTDTTKPTLASKVTCHYTGTLINGTKFDSSVDRGAPASFPLGNVIRGWQEALQLMTVGSTWKLYIPADMAYGENGPPSIGPGATLIFDVALLAVEN
ncbi:MAG: FKBP-type peptidyl-prolyl cis-trans isomerase [Chitinophagaceae bacterium]|nr:FKBP-type peptidyl-prolyl cis-trans isomerase [Chitinophagaceae bacterium]MDP1764194.1 FKBP-type peptidyl-prolyl cis-trans isomerase [Sediminibacterium sp.]MDP1810891.1 FKBP-type peptidyl-prolyl cis-trans isomerase [Sediminibacterium sp.]MDP3128992.1 FKBP-type peptidyl-prolyl cis-trans isomerase [Sediminibacterium sp.]MDP3667787.1 FKBP-type peptidyl-prolyl cis-trans isomerase [Sediminibacterium sp.]